MSEMATKFKIVHFLFGLGDDSFYFFYLGSLQMCANFHTNRLVGRHQGALMSHFCTPL